MKFSKVNLFNNWKKKV